MKAKLMIIILIILVYSTSISPAELPLTFSYQGTLIDSLGEPVPDDIYDIQFRIYEDSGATTLLWSSKGFIPKKTKNGRFYHTIGSTNPFPDSLSLYNDFWLAIIVNNGETISENPLYVVPFSLSELYAREAQEAIAAIFAEAKSQHAESGRWVKDIDQLNELHLVPSAKENWIFTIIPNSRGIERLSATSTAQMPGGAGKIVEFDAVQGKWSGYGSSSKK